MHAVIHMQPLDARRQPIPGVPMKRLRQTVPRDGLPHYIGEAWDLDVGGVKGRETPYFVQVWADNRSTIVEILCASPSKLRRLNSVTFYMDLTVLPLHTSRKYQ